MVIGKYNLPRLGRKQKGQKVCRRNKSFLGLHGRGGNRRLLGAEVFVVRKGLGVPKGRRCGILVTTNVVPAGYSGRKTNIFYT